MLKLLLGVVILTVFVGAAYYFLGFLPTTTKEEQIMSQPIKLGFIGPTSGDAIAYGISIKNSVALAVRDLKTQGKFVDIIYEDGKCNGDEARQAINKLVQEHDIKIVIGGICSGETLAIAPIAEEKHVVLFSPSAASPDITNAGLFVFRNNPSDAYGGKVLSDLLIKKYNKAGIISESTEYAQALRKVFIEKFTEVGGEIVLDQNFAPDTKDFRPILSAIKKSEAEALIINPQTEQVAGALVKEIKGSKISLPLYGHLLPAGTRFLEVAGKAAEGIIFSDLPTLNTTPRVTAFLEDYKKNYGTTNMEFYMGAAYDAVNLLVQAADKNNNDPVKIRDYLYNLAEYDGLIGKYSFDLNGDVVGINLVLKQIKNGKIEDYKETEEANVNVATTTAATPTSTQKQ